MLTLLMLTTAVSQSHSSRHCKSRTLYQTLLRTARQAQAGSFHPLMIRLSTCLMPLAPLGSLLVRWSHPIQMQGAFLARYPLLSWDRDLLPQTRWIHCKVLLPQRMSQLLVWRRYP